MLKLEIRAIRQRFTTLVLHYEALDGHAWPDDRHAWPVDRHEWTVDEEAARFEVAAETLSVLLEETDVWPPTPSDADDDGGGTSVWEVLPPSERSGSGENASDGDGGGFGGRRGSAGRDLSGISACVDQSACVANSPLDSRSFLHSTAVELFDCTPSATAAVPLVDRTPSVIVRRPPPYNVTYDSADESTPIVRLAARRPPLADDSTPTVTGASPWRDDDDDDDDDDGVSAPSPVSTLALRHSAADLAQLSPLSSPPAAVSTDTSSARLSSVTSSAGLSSTATGATSSYKESDGGGVSPAPRRHRGAAARRHRVYTTTTTTTTSSESCEVPPPANSPNITPDTTPLGERPPCVGKEATPEMTAGTTDQPTGRTDVADGGDKKPTARKAALLRRLQSLRRHFRTKQPAAPSRDQPGK